MSNKQQEGWVPRSIKWVGLSTLILVIPGGLIAWGAHWIIRRRHRRESLSAPQVLPLIDPITPLSLSSVEEEMIPVIPISTPIPLVVGPAAISPQPTSDN